LDDECRNVVTEESRAQSPSILVYDVRSGASLLAWRAGYAPAPRAATLPPNSRDVVTYEAGLIRRFPLLSRDELIDEARRRVGNKFDTDCQKYLERPCPSGK
jgi:hypothetical protein